MCQSPLSGSPGEPSSKADLECGSCLDAWAVPLPFECGNCTRIVILWEQAEAHKATTISATIQTLSSPPASDT